jgi:hypothetical protein
MLELPTVDKVTGLMFQQDRDTLAHEAPARQLALKDR